AAACRDGRFSFNAWIHPSPRFDRLSFPRILLALDKTGVPEVAPRPVTPPVLNDRDRSGVGFTLEVGRDGLAFLPEGL
ncbi:MAG: hypothetical protein K2Q10_04010, partial [Rhodospirillales bacterium]|nr:hypothetical protein [Rhodospirillales bacterium]